MKQFTSKSSKTFGLFLIILIVTSCKNEAEKTLPTDETEVNMVSTQKESTAKIYNLKGDCDSFIQGIDFSSLCVTEQKQLEYEVENSSGIRCQYEILKDNWKEETHFVITWKDYANYETEKIEMDQLLTKNSFQKTGKRLYKKTKKIANLGDDAYIGYEEIGGGSDKNLSIILYNVAVSIKTNTSAENCLSSDDELLKLGKLIIDKIKK